MFDVLCVSKDQSRRVGEKAGSDAPEDMVGCVYARVRVCVGRFERSTRRVGKQGRGGRRREGGGKEKKERRK